MQIILGLMHVFCKIALGAFGGGLVTIPFIHHELVTLRPWLTETSFNQTVALAQMTPGPVALNAATFVGYRMAGFWGSFWASAALVTTPALIIATLLWLIGKASRERQEKISAFQKALRPAVAGMLSAAFWTLAKPLVPRDFSGWLALSPKVILIITALLCLLLSNFKIFKKYPQLLILLAAVIGLAFKNFLAA